MKRHDLENLKEKVACATLLGKAGFAVDAKESTRRAFKWRRAAEIIIVTHDGRGWFDPLSEAKGDIFSLVTHLDGGEFMDAIATVADLVGHHAVIASWTPPSPSRAVSEDVSTRWTSRRAPWPGSHSWTYLSKQRFLPPIILKIATDQSCLREGPFGSMWAAHTNDAGVITGWEERGPQWRGFATGGSKVLFRLGSQDATRLCVVEAAIDAMSLASIEGLREETLYLSTGGGWSPTTHAALRLLGSRPNTSLVAATDANIQGDAFADRLRQLAEEVGCGWQRLRPHVDNRNADDWNAVLQERAKEKGERRMGEKRGLPHARRTRQG
ncbi:DUF3991 and toprim domain-containing protein [Pararhizobium antarcticum]|uniref:Toprim domain-containing protein n=1 Tax=Pararhizobium antarcticum TaxID=1798805 RepID=A0A657LKZ5_9HYPH|nr:DUF3991 and toprim domain-containing protein [Pararhizobium antarcticum]OJF90757.1 hypothetical protein AX760_23980 [Pararhizobium antarcticum]OJF99454.1 hypothetical protein AX761_10715 [Rhizobium sp. 58]